MRIGYKTGGPGDGVSYRGSHGQTVRVGRSGIQEYYYRSEKKTCNFAVGVLNHCH